MATIPIVNTFDKRVGIVTSLITMTITIIILLLITFEFPDPPPKDAIVVAETIMPEEIVLSDLKIMTSGASGAPSDDPIDKPQEQVQKVLTSNTPNPNKETSGQSNHTNGSNVNNPASSATPSDNPFGAGGSDSEGPAYSAGPGGPGVPGPHSGSGSAKDRSIIQLPDWSSINRDITTKVTVCLNLTINTNGDVVDLYVVQSKTTTTNYVLIQKIKNLVKAQTKFNKIPGNGTIELQKNFTVTPN